ncbi:MAG: hypothetical protein IJ597_06640 [Synergistaceae bacterium]|nr:hypothetical protein [Synergistaceae bacterium]
MPAKEKDSLADERFISNVLLEIEEDKIPLSVDYKTPEKIQAIEVFENSRPDESQKSQELQTKAEEKESEAETQI